VGRGREIYLRLNVSRASRREGCADASTVDSRSLTSTTVIITNIEAATITIDPIRLVNNSPPCDSTADWLESTACH
jgi:hypothetical protein